MAVIIAVHGTYFTHDYPGISWWQAGGLLQRDIASYLKSDDGRVIFEPFEWEGHNSEASRWAAGKTLLKRLYELEEKGERYCIIGHSHGGSIISHALVLDSLFRRSKLPLMSKWITVGTPFIHQTRHSALFYRLGILGQAAFAILIVYGSIFLANLAGTFSNNISLDADLLFSNYGLYLILFSISAVTLFAVLACFQPRKLKASTNKISTIARAAFESRWCPINHADDEAIASLAKTTQLKFSPISPRFAVEPIAALSIFVLPALIIGFASTAVGHATVRNLTLLSTGEIYFSPEGWLQATSDTAIRLTSLPAQLLIRLAAPRIESLVLQYTITGASMFAAVGFMYLLSYLILQGSRAVAFAISTSISTMLNRATVAGIKRTAWGSDSVGETAARAASVPHWLAAQTITVLPNPLSSEITEQSNKAASAAIPRVRTALRDLAFFDDRAKTFEQLAAALNLSYNELIHTTYFDVPSCRKLIIYALSQSRGFGPTEYFVQDPDFAVIEASYSSLVGESD